MSTAFMEGFGRGHNEYLSTRIPEACHVVDRDEMAAIDPELKPPVNGNHCFMISRPSTSQYNAFAWTEDIFGDVVTEFYIKFRYQVNKWSSDGTIFAAGNFAQNQSMFQIDEYDGYLQAVSNCSSYAGTKVTSNFQLRAKHWYLIELWVSINPGACSSTYGAYEFRIDGIVQGKSDNARVNSSGSYFDRFKWDSAYNTYGFIDDLVFDSTAAFDLHTSDTSVHWFTPNANGTNSAWTPSSGSNYQCVNVDGTKRETDENYIVTNQVGDKDSYPLSTDSTGTITKIKTVKTEHRASREGRSVPRNLNPYLRINGSEYSGTEFPESQPSVVQAKPMRVSWDQNPDTSADWTESDILNLELGIESES